jgi:hypothetical protein
MPKARTVKMHLHALAMSVVRDDFHLVLRYYCTVESVLEGDDFSWATEEEY